MHIGIAILTDKKMHNIGRQLSYDINEKYETGIESALLPQHISLKQSFLMMEILLQLKNSLMNFSRELNRLKS